MHCQHVGVKYSLSFIPADESKCKSDYSFAVEGANQRASEFLHDNEVHERSCVEVVPPPNVLLEFLQRFHLSHGFYGLNLYAGRYSSHGRIDRGRFILVFMRVIISKPRKLQEKAPNS